MTGLDAVRAATWAHHARAEQAGIVADILAGTAGRYGVALYLRNLLPVYRVLDASVAGEPELARGAVIEADLAEVAPDDALPVLPEAEAYAACVAGSDEAGLLGHAYVRYLGDLNGGRVMQRRLSVCLGRGAERLGFHLYPGVGDLVGFRDAYRSALDLRVLACPIEAVLAAAIAAFEHNIALSEAVALAAGAAFRPHSSEARMTGGAISLDLDGL